MDLITLDSLNRPNKVIQGYDSLIWTERFNTMGDFQLVTSDIERTLQLLPEDTFVSLMDSSYTMIVETHKIERKKGEAAKLTVTGRSFESLLERRVAIQSANSLTGSTEYTRHARNPAELAYLMINDICIHGIVSPADIFSTSYFYPAVPLEYSPIDMTPREYVIPRGNLLTRVQELLQTEGEADYSVDPPIPATKQYGILGQRPDGPVFADNDNNWGPIQLRIYSTRMMQDTIYFDAGRELLDDGTYLFSKVGSANAAYGVGDNLAAFMHEGTTEPSGLNRRVMLIDSSESDISEVNILQNYMSQELAQAKETALYDGQINPDLNPYKYGVDYFLGNVVKLVGDYGLNALARVTEYIRTEDATGEKAYPTLATIVP